MEGIDSNSLILLAKKKNKEKLKTRVKSSDDKKLTKSQKRKLKKLAEHNEAKKLLSKSLEALDKYKISEDAHSLMFSSQNVGQAMTRKDKRSRDLLFSKAGLEVPENGLNAKRKRSESWDQITSDDHDGSDPINVINGVRSEGTCKVMEPYTKNKSFHQSLDSDKKTGGAAVEPYGDSALDSDFLIKRTDDSDEEEEKRGILDPRPLNTPFVVHVSRPKEVEDARKDLPVVQKEQEIMQDINKFIVVGIEGGTGSGKTTQVPQFLYEAGYGLTGCNIRSGVIGVTQPRRVAVFSTAKRVAYELGLTLGREVGFQVRHEKKIGENSSIKIMTDGILLRELQNDFLLKRYSVLILDEVHERSLNTDILIGMLSGVIMQRLEIYKDQCARILVGEQIRPEDRIKPLKVILMSANLQVEDFKKRRIFGEHLPTEKAKARKFDLTIRYARRTELKDYIGTAFKKVLQIHKRCPPGGILVFVTGQREVEYLCRKLRSASRQFMAKSSEVNSENGTKNPGTDIDQIDGCDMKEINEALDTHTTRAQGLTLYDDYDDYDDYDEYDESDNVDSYPSPSSESDIEWDSERDDKDMNQDFSEAASNPEGVGKEMSPLALNVIPTKVDREERGQSYGSLHVLPIYAMLPAEAQHRVFNKTKEGERLVVVATNVAETSITIEGIKYVVDTGRVKVKKYDPSNGMESYEVQWISEASANQRAGRAGRTGPGYCFPLYTKAAMENMFPKHSLPEILKRPLDGVVLFMKSIGISKVTNFPFLTPPDPMALAEAERCLKALEALDSEGRPTPLGKTMTHYPMSPRHSRLLLLAIQISKRETNHIRPNLVLGYAVAVAAVLSSTDPNSRQAKSKGDEENKDKKLRRNQMKECHKRFRGKFANLKSDALTIAFALQCFEQSKNPSQFCNENALHQKTMDDMSKLRKQLLQLVFNQRYSGLEHEFSWTQGSARDVEHDWSYDKNTLSQTEENILCQAICAGWADRVAKRVRRTVGVEERERKVNAVRYQSSVVKETVFLRPWSTVARSAPEFLVYNEMLDGKRSDKDEEYSMPFISAATSVESEWLVKFARNLCTFSAPLEDPKPFYDPLNDQALCYVIPYFGPHLWELPLCKVPIKDVQQRVAIFAHAFLDGHVLPCLKFAKKYMSALPDLILRPEALGQKRVGNLLSKLITRARTVDNCAMLREAWSENARYLYSEIRDWFQEGFHSVFEELWENMRLEAFLEPQERFPKKKGHRKSG